MAQTNVRAESVSLAGQIGLWASVTVAVILGIHPFGSTELYDDGFRFLDHVNGYWIVLHLAGVLALLAWPMVIDVWGRDLETPAARLVGRWSGGMAWLGMAVGALHLVGTDTMTFVAFSDTFRNGTPSLMNLVAGNPDLSAEVAVGADLLLRLHAATLTAWVVVFFFAVPALLAVACWLDGRIPRWLAALAALSAVLSAVAVVLTISARQWTTVSEMGFFRSGATLFIVWMIITTWWMRRGTVVPASAA